MTTREMLLSAISDTGYIPNGETNAELIAQLRDIALNGREPLPKLDEIMDLLGYGAFKPNFRETHHVIIRNAQISDFLGTQYHVKWDQPFYVANQKQIHAMVNLLSACCRKQGYLLFASRHADGGGILISKTPRVDPA